MSSDPTETLSVVVEQSAEALQQAVDRVDGRWSGPSILDGWSVADLVGHVTGSAEKILAQLRGDPIADRPSDPSGGLSDDPPARLREVFADVRRALPGADLSATRPSPGGEATLAEALRFPVSDLAIHAWDVDRSLGRSRELPPETLGYIRALVDGLPEPMLRRPGGFGPETTPRPEAGPTERVMAFLGRETR